MNSASALPLTRPPADLCLLRLSAIGDVINAVPVMRTLQQHWPDTDLTWIVGANEAPLVADLPGVGFVTYDKKAGWRSRRAVRRELRGRQFDVFMHMQFALRANLLGSVVPARLRLGYDRERAREGHSLFINERIGTPSSPHVVDIYFAFLEALGIQERVMDWTVPIPQAERAAMGELLPADERYLVISPCGSSRHRDWLPNRYAAVADEAAARYGYTVVLSGGPTERERELASQVRAAMRKPAIDLVGQTTLKGLLALLERAALLITPDSGRLTWPTPPARMSLRLSLRVTAAAAVPIAVWTGAWTDTTRPRVSLPASRQRSCRGAVNSSSRVRWRSSRWMMFWSAWKRCRPHGLRDLVVSARAARV